ncbi:hypothetical protein HK097_005393, partial [Rhizophlyctis rosea]
GLPMIRDVSHGSFGTHKSDEESQKAEGDEASSQSPSTETQPLTTSQTPQTQPESEPTIHLYDALLFATDNDFLESSRVRAIFRENAVTPEDAKLFEMPPYLGVDDAPPPMLIVDDSPICEWCYPTAATLERHGPLMRVFHRSKCYMLAILVLFAMFCFIYFTLRSDKVIGKDK